MQQHGAGLALSAPLTRWASAGASGSEDCWRDERDFREVPSSVHRIRPVEEGPTWWLGARRDTATPFSSVDPGVSDILAGLSACPASGAWREHGGGMCGKLAAGGTTSNTEGTARECLKGSGWIRRLWCAAELDSGGLHRYHLLSDVRRMSPCHTDMSHLP
jgi:hypothetical protein